MIYLSSPYSHPEPSVREHRYREACRATAALLLRSAITYSPIVHSHPLTEFGTPNTWEFWKGVDLPIIDRCDAVLVLALDGWKQSVGVQAELQYAASKAIPIEVISPVSEQGEFCERDLAAIERARLLPSRRGVG